jgi:hypothetical protein
MDNLDPQGQSKPMFGMLRNNRGEVNLAEDPVTDDPGMSADPNQGPVDPAPAADPAPVADPAPAQTGSGWKDKLSSDLRNSPVVQKFGDDAEGLSKFAEGYNNLEKLLGHEKVPIPKGQDDAEGWARFSKALGIPDAAEGYGLPDAALPENMQGLTLDKNKFAEVVHAHKLTPDQANGLWNAYQEINVNAYNKAMEAHEERISGIVNQLKSKWGDTYETNVELGQAVINKFSNDQEMNDYLTNALSQDPRGVEFLAKIGNQFAENKISEFQMKRFSMAPDEAQREIDEMRHDINGPYMNQANKFTEAQHMEAVYRVNHLEELIAKAKGQSM